MATTSIHLPRVLARKNLFRLLSAVNIRKQSGRAQPAYEIPTVATDELCDEHIFTEQHVELRNTLNKIIEKDINPYVEQWENDGLFPAHQVFKKLGDAGFLGVNKPVEYGGLGLDYSYSVAVAEELGTPISKKTPPSLLILILQSATFY